MKIKTITIMITVTIAASIFLSCIIPPTTGAFTGTGGTGAGTGGTGTGTGGTGGTGTGATGTATGGGSGSGMITGNGNHITSERAVSGFDKVSSTGSADVRFHASRDYRAFVTVDSNIDQYVEVRASNGVLTIGLKSGSYRLTKWIVDVYCPFLTGVTMSGSGSFKTADKLVVSTFDSRIAGSGDIDAAVECNTFYANMSGSGRLNITGSGRDSNIQISGSGNFNGYNFVINNATVNVSGSATANVSVTSYLNATISGSGEINYRGNPVVNSKVTGSGRLRQR
jgi:hypothetical protein